MRKTTTSICFALAVSLGTAALAQDEPPVAAASDASSTETAEVALPVAVKATKADQEAVAAAAAAPNCELHVFPTLEGQAQTTSLLSGFGIIGAVADAAANKDRNISEAEYLKEALGPKFQVAALQTIDLVSEFNLPEGTAVMFETPIADREITTKAKTRLTDSTADCYAELLITQNLYQKKAIYGRSLNNRFIFKDFRSGLTESKLIKGRGGNGLSHFPPKTTDETEAAEADLREAFTKNLLEYSSKI